MLTDWALNGDVIYSATMVVGLVLGSLAVLSSLFVFVRRSKLGADGMILTCLGGLLVSLSLWQSVNIKVAGAEMKLERVKQSVEAVKQTADAVIKQARQQDATLRAKMEEWANQAKQGGNPTQVSPEEIQILIQQWKTITDMTSNLSKDINDMTMSAVRNLR